MPPRLSTMADNSVIDLRYHTHRWHCSSQVAVSKVINVQKTWVQHARSIVPHWIISVGSVLFVVTRPRSLKKLRFAAPPPLLETASSAYGCAWVVLASKHSVLPSALRAMQVILQCRLNSQLAFDMSVTLGNANSKLCHIWYSRLCPETWPPFFSEFCWHYWYASCWLARGCGKVFNCISLTFAFVCVCMPIGVTLPSYIPSETVEWPIHSSHLQIYAWVTGND